MAPPGAAGEAARGPGLRRGRDAARPEAGRAGAPVPPRRPPRVLVLLLPVLHEDARGAEARGRDGGRGPARALLPQRAAALVFRILPVPCSFFRPDKCSLGGLLSGERTSIKLANNDKALLKKKVRDTINAAKAAVVAIFAPVRILVDKWKAKAEAAKVAVEDAAKAAAGAKKDEAPAPAPASKVPTFSLNFGADGACALPTPRRRDPGHRPRQGAHGRDRGI